MKLDNLKLIRTSMYVIIVILLASCLYSLSSYFINQQIEQRFVEEASFQHMTDRVGERLFIKIDEDGDVSSSFCRGTSQVEEFFGIDHCKIAYENFCKNYPQYADSMICR